MESQRPGRLRRTQGAPQSSVEIIYEEFLPNSDWTHDSHSHILLLDLSGFRKDEVKVQVDNLGKLRVYGERKVNERRYIRFNRDFQVPSDSDIQKISGKFENGLLFVIMPLKVVETKEEPHKVMVTSDSAKKEEKPTQKQEDAAAIGKDSQEKEVEPPQKQEPKKEDAPTGKEEKPSQKRDPKKEEAAVLGKDSSKQEEKAMSTQKEEPKKGDGEKKEEKPMSTEEEEPKKEDGAKKEEKPTSTQKDEPTQKEEKEELEIRIGGSKKKEKATHQEIRSEKQKVEGHKISREKRRKNELEFGGDGKQGWRGEKVGRNETLCEDGEAMAIEGEDQEKDLEAGLFDRVLQEVDKNKYIIATAALAFSFGVYLARKLR